ncbi:MULTISPECIES: efflux RND transporter permease subunit [Acidithiobacillus]|jgi:multidrug efflux pump subunit AcrB|uniref:Acriflavin resistance protein n=1 Tax=Acidithiobacillus caldus (strain ATCC 51756 / DSM 8584 / KU) TaxID=637389 RepID=A0A059ZSN4_ACICK|nr:MULTISPECIES: efflux RND transporter permease subunit [Acidithiobacillus]AIA54655.1 Acriflavin resistance protein [Acidithiobacillus caldus ATCC 51756]MBU2728971.1 efflux RND transporter permease subunit [Acidithiobacillus caldus]MBU2735895.1 efflux RND transporter permease subunit [Acidithiobacillus caldus ATCC 51756]MBU2746020.1 efflux RND transporter permease subunit [Acidithiobacillus caldus]MBU2780456.1 efflux RND transporter permease subunit [Acidithiobacillus caldus]
MSTCNGSPTPQAPEKKSLGLAGSIARIFINSPLAPLSLVVLLAAGILGLVSTPRASNPQISVPMVDIFVPYPGHSPGEVARMVADPLQQLMSELPGVRHVYSVSNQGEAMVTVRFEVGEHMAPALVAVYNKLAANMDRIPVGAGKPLVRAKGINSVPFMTFTLWSESVGPGTLDEIAQSVLKRLKEVPDTGESFIVHGATDALNIDVQPSRLAAYDLPPQAVAEVVRSANQESQSGSAEGNNQHLAILSGGFLRSPRQVENLVVGVFHGAPVYLSQVASVHYGPIAPHSLVTYSTGAAHRGEPIHNAPAVTIALAKTAGSNAVSVAEALIARIHSLEGSVIPENVHVSITRDDGKTANDKVNSLLFKLLVATAAVSALIFLTLGWRAAAVVVITIPLILLITVFAAWLLGITINRVSLFGLIFSIGILVDDSIVIVENVYRRWLQENNTSTETLIDAVREVGNPTILATFTVIAALLPMGFVGGMMGPYMAPIPVLGSVAMLSSLLIAFALAPWLIVRFKPNLRVLEKMHHREARQAAWLRKFFAQTLIPLVRRKLYGRLFLAGIVVAFFGSLALFVVEWVPFTMLPHDNSDEFDVVVNMPAGTALADTANATYAIEERLRGMRDVVALQSYVGTPEPYDFNGMVRHYYLRNQPWQAMIHVQLVDSGDRSASSSTLAKEARRRIEAVAQSWGARLQVVQTPPGPPVLAPVVAEVYGPSAAVRDAVAKHLTTVFEHSRNLTDVNNTLMAPHDLLAFRVDATRAGMAGISNATVNDTLALVMGGYELGDFHPYGQTLAVPIFLQAPLYLRSNVQNLANLPIPSPHYGVVPLYSLGNFQRVPAEAPIYQQDLRPVQYVMADTQGRLDAPLYGMLEVQSALRHYLAPTGKALGIDWISQPSGDRAAIKWGGAWTVTYTTFRDMGAAFLVALVLIYMLVVWEFGNFIIPAIIMVPIPLTLIGILPGHWLFGASFTATSMIGFIALAGIIVRNSILLVDYSQQRVAEGYPVLDALIEACATRTRPIVITALALMLGSAEIITSPIFRGMGISLLFGVMVSTILTLLVIPMGCVSGRRAFCPASIDLDNGTMRGKPPFPMSRRNWIVVHPGEMPLTRSEKVDSGTRPQRTKHRGGNGFALLSLIWHSLWEDLRAFVTAWRRFLTRLFTK